MTLVLNGQLFLLEVNRTGDIPIAPQTIFTSSTVAVMLGVHKQIPVKSLIKHRCLVNIWPSIAKLGIRLLNSMNGQIGLLCEIGLTLIVVSWTNVTSIGCVFFDWQPRYNFNL